MSTSKDVEMIFADYVQLVERQKAAPDWPYPGSLYVESGSAADERWCFWHDLKEHYPEDILDEAFSMCWHWGCAMK